MEGDKGSRLPFCIVNFDLKLGTPKDDSCSAAQVIMLEAVHTQATSRTFLDSPYRQPPLHRSTR